MGGVKDGCCSHAVVKGVDFTLSQDVEGSGLGSRMEADESSPKSNCN